MAVRYRLTGRLETGELAELYRAKRRNQPVVVKLFHARTSDASYARELAEVNRVLAPLKKPGVLKVLDMGLVHERLAVVREDVGGYTLGQVLQRLNTREVVLPAALVLLLAMDLLELLSQAHEAGALHGALTPGNILLSAEGRPAICDFGALRALNAAPRLRRRFGGRGRGSYRGPEIAKGEQPEVESDIYSLGAITYELLTLREAGSGRAPLSVRREVLPPPSRFDRRLNARIDPIVMRAIDPVPSRRFRSCQEMASAVGEFLLANGGMPVRDELRRFVTGLFPNEVRVDEAPELVPFADPFELVEVTGVSLPEPELAETSVVERPSFSSGELHVGTETLENIPVLDPVPPQASGPALDDGTEPGTTKLEEAWHAPPSSAPVAKKPLAVTAHPALGSAAMRRMRVVESIEALEEGKTSQTALPKLVPKPQDPWAYAAEPAPEVSRSRRARTVERHLSEAARFRQRVLQVLIGVTLTGLVTLGLLLWYSLARPAFPPKGGTPPVKRPPPTSLAPKPAVEPLRESESTDDWHLPPTKNAGFLSVTSDVPAMVYVDGQRVRKPTPLVRYPVLSGERKIAIVEARTGRRREFSLTLSKGQLIKLEEQFGPR
ncbi:MAG: serine/threonine protein kinase [Myxococcota bacterium]